LLTGPEDELAAVIRAVNRSAGEAARYLNYVFLCVATFNAESVKLHKLTPIVLVQAVLPSRARLNQLARSVSGSCCFTERAPAQCVPHTESSTQRQGRLVLAKPRRVYSNRIRRGAQPVVKIEEHRRTMRRRPPISLQTCP